ncbi:MAG: LapA family protein [Desulfobacteraceae bacterium]
MKHLKFILAIILMLFVVIVIVQNHGAMSEQVAFKVDLRFIKYTTSAMSLYFIVTIAFLFGVLVTGFYGIIERFRLKGEIKTLVSTSREKDKELNSLRNLPITSDDVSPSQVDTTEEE